MNTVLTEAHGDVLVVTINRPEVRNAVDGATARALAETFRGFDADSSMRVAVLTGAAGTFCAGADLKALAVGQGNTLSEEGDGPMGPTRMLLSKPVVAAVEGHAVAAAKIYRECAGSGLAHQTGGALQAALQLARELAALPQTCMRSDRLSSYEQWSLPMSEAVRNEFRRGLSVIESGETVAGAQRFASGQGRHGT